ncbi:unnamed protein product [Effrenium voratum]|nr:unnamed protein product [Effrenium voratum]
MELNSCTREDFLALGLQDVAEAICQHRPFKSLEEVLEVAAEAPESLAALKTCRVELKTAVVEGTTVQCYEDLKLYLPGGAENVRRAWFGDPNYAWEDEKGKGAICTEAVQGILRLNRPLITSFACLGCDPIPGVLKQFRVELLNTEGLHFEEPVFPKHFATMEEVPSAPRWVAFIRHAQAGHNADPALVQVPDNPLTEQGVAQALRAKEGAAGAAIRAADLVVTSPLTRAMQTAGLLGASAATVVDALVTERWSAPCDEGTEKSKLLLREGTPGLEEIHAWGGWDALPETWWPQPGEDQWTRAEALIAKAKHLPQDRIVFVGHGGFWERVLGRYLPNCEAVFCDRSLC